MTNLILNDEEVALFKLFREHQDTFLMMLEGRVFDTKNGQAILNFNASGTLCSIETHMIVARRK